MDRREMLQLAAVTAAGAVYPKLGEVADNEVSDVPLLHLHQRRLSRVIHRSMEDVVVHCETMGNASLRPLLVAAVDIAVEHDRIVTIDNRSGKIVDDRQANPDNLVVTFLNMCGDALSLRFLLGESQLVEPDLLSAIRLCSQSELRPGLRIKMRRPPSVFHETAVFSLDMGFVPLLKIVCGPDIRASNSQP